jgi:hypothetical protein
MDGGKEALEKLAREAVALYGGEAPKLLRHRAEIAVQYGDKVSAKEWRELAGIAARITRRRQDRAKPSPARPRPGAAPTRSSEPSRVLRKKGGRQ